LEVTKKKRKKLAGALLRGQEGRCPPPGKQRPADKKKGKKRRESPPAADSLRERNLSNGLGPLTKELSAPGGKKKKGRSRKRGGSPTKEERL